MDPNAEVKRTKGTRYVNADWSEISRTKKPGLQEVATETVVYADGRIKEFILDGSGNRYPDAARQDFDEDQRKAWDAQKKDQPQSPTERKPTRTYTGTDPQTGRPATVSEWPDGTKTYEEIKPTAGQNQTTQIEGTPTANGFDNERPQMVTRDASGRVVKAEPLTPAEMNEWRGNRERSRNPGGKTDAEIAAEGKETQQQNKPSYITAQDGTVYEVAPGKPPKPIIQGAKPGQVVNVGNGRLVRVGNDGKAEVIYDDPSAGIKVQQDKDGNWVRIDGAGNVTQINVQGGASTPQGPPLPQIVLGQSQEALRAYRAELNRLVELGPGRGGISPAVADKRWTEAKDVATNTIAEARIYAEDEQSRRNADVNLRTNAASNATSGFNTALDFVKSINDKLPEGSAAGGKAFAALLEVQQMQAERMGAGRNEFSSGRPRSMEARGVDAATTSTISTTNNAINGLLQQPAVTTAPAAVEAAAPPTPPAVPGTPSPVGDTGAPAVSSTPPEPPPPVIDGIPYNPPAHLPGHRPGEPIGMEAPPDLPALADYQRIAPPMAAPVAAPGSEMPAAVMGNRIASVPPWQLSEDDYRFAVENGMEEDFWRVPGRVA